jgi:flagellar biosynthesis/type III secretory pathway chaperone
VAARSDNPCVDVAALSECLTEECASLEHLVFKLEEEHLVLASGRHRLLPQANAEVQAALAALDLVERERARLTALVIDDVGLGAGSTLGDIADAVQSMDTHSAGVLRSHRESMSHLLGRVQDLAEENRVLLARGIAATADALALLGAAPVSYDGSGIVATRSSSAVVIDTRA